MKTDLELQLHLVKMFPEKIRYRKWLSYGETGTRENVTFTYIENGRELCDDSWLHVCWLIEQGLDDDTYEKFGVNITKPLQEDPDSESMKVAKQVMSASWQQRATALIAVDGEK